MLVFKRQNKIFMIFLHPISFYLPLLLLAGIFVLASINALDVSLVSTL